MMTKMENCENEMLVTSRVTTSKNRAKIREE